MQSELRKEYMKERRRFLAALRREEKKGFLFDESIVPDIPKRVTKKSVRDIKEMSTAEIRRSAVAHLDRETGEIRGAQEVYREIRRKSTEKRRASHKKKTPPVPPEWRIALEQFYTQVEYYENSNARLAPMLREWMDGAVSVYGEKVCGTAIASAAREGYVLTYETVYKVEAYNTYTDGVRRHIDDTLGQEMTDEEMERYDDAIEADTWGEDYEY